VVEADERVRDEEARLGEVGAVVGERDRRLEAGGVVVPDVADHRRRGTFGFLDLDQPRPVADERVAAESATLDRLEQEARAAERAQAEVCPQRGDQLGCDFSRRRRHGRRKRPRAGGLER
jgi:hypothetical protein